MIFVKLFEEFKETPKNTPVLYKDDNLEVKVVKTFDSSKEQGKDTSWCSNYINGFYSHSKTANMYRFNFSDGYKLRLTWDYITQKASELGSFSGGTHWGQGGEVDGEDKFYDVLRPQDDSEPFLIDWGSDKEEREIVSRIESIPQKAIDSVHEYQDKNSQEKSGNLNKMYSEIKKIKVVNCVSKDTNTRSDGTKYKEDYIEVKISYLENTYDIKISKNYFKDSVSIRFGNDFVKKFKNKYALHSYVDKELLVKYIYDKVREFYKKNGMEFKVSLPDYLRD